MADYIRPWQFSKPPCLLCGKAGLVAPHTKRERLIIAGDQIWRETVNVLWGPKAENE